jgi:hypothetical protein
LRTRATTQATLQDECLPFLPLLGPVLLPLPSQHHSTAPPSAKRYDNRYELRFLG